MAFYKAEVNGIICTQTIAPTLLKLEGWPFQQVNTTIYVPATGTGYDADGWPTNKIKYWYDVDVAVNTEEGGKASASTSGEVSTTLLTQVKQGVDAVTLTATPNKGYHFVKWQAPEGITITDAASPNTTFTIPDDYAVQEDITITAVFEAHDWSTEWKDDATTHWHTCTFTSCDVKDVFPHTPAYTASDATTITATCGDCERGLGTATISASSGTYTGSAYSATISGTDTMASMTWNIAYKEQGGTALSSPPSDAGEYTASITIGGAAASVDFSIAQAEGSGTVTIQDWTYGDVASTPVPESSTNGTGSVTYVYAATDSGTYSNTTAPTDAGSYQVTATFAATQNYKEHTDSAEFTISPKQAVALTIEGVEASYTYTGSAIQPEITVKDGDKTLTPDTDYTVTYGTNTTVAGGGSVTITMINPNYTGSQTVNFALTKAVPAYTPPSGLSAVFGQTLKEVSLGNGSGSGVWSWPDSTLSVGKAGTRIHKALFTPADTANYQTMTVSLSVEVAKADLELSADPPAAGAIEYGQTLAASALSGGAVKNKATGDAVEGTWSWVDKGLQPEGAGTYRAEAAFTANDADDHNSLTITDISVVVGAVTPEILMVADPAAPIAGEMVSVQVTVTNPHDHSLTGPEAALTYQIGESGEQPLTGGSFTIPESTATGTVITIKAATEATREGNYGAAISTYTLTIVDCSHTGTTVLTYGGEAHW